MMDKNELIIEIKEKKSWLGETMFYLYVNGTWVTSSTDLETIKKKVAIATKVFENGEHEEKVVFSDKIVKLTKE